MDSKIWLFPKNFPKFSPKKSNNNIPIQAHNLHPVYHIWVSKLVKWPKYSVCTFSWCLHFLKNLKWCQKFILIVWNFNKKLSKKKCSGLTQNQPIFLPPKSKKSEKKIFHKKNFASKIFSAIFLKIPFLPIFHLNFSQNLNLSENMVTRVQGAP